MCQAFPHHSLIWTKIILLQMRMESSTYWTWTNSLIILLLGGTKFSCFIFKKECMHTSVAEGKKSKTSSLMTTLKQIKDLYWSEKREANFQDRFFFSVSPCTEEAAICRMPTKWSASSRCARERLRSSTRQDDKYLITNDKWLWSPSPNTHRRITIQKSPGSANQEKGGREKLVQAPHYCPQQLWPLNKENKNQNWEFSPPNCPVYSVLYALYNITQQFSKFSYIHFK